MKILKNLKINNESKKINASEVALVDSNNKYKILDDAIGDLLNLNTNDKSSIVNATNEINGKGLKKLWENPSPNDSFPSGTVNLSSSDYDFYIVFYRVSKGWTTRMNAAIFLKGYGGTLYHPADAQMSNGTSWKIANFSRQLYADSDTQLRFEEVTMATPNGDSYSSNNLSKGDWLIPEVIYGGKF